MTGLPTTPAGFGPIGITTAVALSPDRQERLARRLAEVVREEATAELGELRARVALLEELLEGSAASNGGTAAIAPPVEDPCEDGSAAPPADTPPSERSSGDASQRAGGAAPDLSPPPAEPLPQDRRARQSRAAQLGLETRRQVQALDADAVRAAVRALNAAEIPATAAAIARRLVPTVTSVPAPIIRHLAKLERDRRIVAAGSYKKGVCYQATGPDVDGRPAALEGEIPDDVDDPDPAPETAPPEVAGEMDDDAVDRELGAGAGEHTRSKKQDMILDWLTHNGPADSGQIARALGYDDARSIIGALARLADRGRVGSSYQGSGSTAKRQWHAVDLDVAITGNPSIHVRHDGDTGSSLQGRLLDLLLLGPKRIPDLVLAANEGQPEEAWVKATEVAHAISILGREGEVEKRHAGLYHRTRA